MPEIFSWIGVDPGRTSGSISLLPSDKFPEDPQSWKLADLTDKDIFDLLKRLTGYRPVRAVLEQVHAMPRQGVSSTFKFGTSFGELKMALVGCQIPFHLVTPQKWQKTLGCQTKGDKNVTKQKAQSFWPEMKITHYNADSLLMAYYGMRFLRD